MCNHEAKLYGRCLACGEQVDPAPVEDFTPAPTPAPEPDAAAIAATVEGGPLAALSARLDAIEVRVAGIVGDAVVSAAQAGNAYQRAMDVENRLGIVCQVVESLRADVETLRAAASTPPAGPESPAPVDETPVP